MKEPFWEDGYRDAAGDVFGAPSEEFEWLAARIPRTAPVFDVGCGDGRNALYLAERGLSVRAFDISETAIARLRDRADHAGLPVEAWVGDLTEFEFEGDVSAVVTHGVLHFVPRVAADEFVEAAKEATIPGGVHVHVVFTDALPVPEDLAPFVRHTYRGDELCRRYDGWRLEVSRLYVKEDEHPGGIRHRHALHKFVAWKPEVRARGSARKPDTTAF